MTRRLICIHGHFYQPPRENPWLEEVEVQDSAAPFHDWNDRINAECYGPNGAARLKTPQGRINDIVNNYRHISFNFGPTLLAWLERHAPETYRTVLEADAYSVQARGHGNALAQGYNHAILPLCSPRDLRTQIRWGLADFRARFRREPEGMWLPETAADLDTLRALVDEGLRFTVLSPYQAVRVRAPGGQFVDARDAQFDPTRPYRIELGGGRSIAIFFYDGPIARAVAFGEGLQHGDDLVRRLEGGLNAARGHDELLTVAVDGETFGHHRKGGDEVLAAALRAIAARSDLSLVNLGQALELLPLEWEAEIAEKSSWSCSHGVERWRSDCGCSCSGQPGWRQTWRGPLRAALDALRDQLAALFEAEAGQLLRDPWAARDAYLEVVTDPQRRMAEAFLARHARTPLDPASRVRALQLLELQRNAMLMYTSCGWFFSELSGLETVQVLKYAARAIQLAQASCGVDLEPDFLAALQSAPSNLPELGDGAAIYQTHAKPSVVALDGVAAHHAIASLRDELPRGGSLFCYDIAVRSRRREASGAATLSVSHLTVRSQITLEEEDVSVCVLHFGGSDFRCGVRSFEAGQHQELLRRVFGKLDKLSLAQLLREIDLHFQGRDYTLRDLFIDERRRVARLLLEETMRRYENHYLQIFEENRRLIDFLREISSPVPRPLQVAADVALTHQAALLAQALGEGTLEVGAARQQLLGAAELSRRLGARIDGQAVLPGLHAALEATLRGLLAGKRGAAAELAELLELSDKLGLHLDLWGAQNLLWRHLADAQGALDRDELRKLSARLWFDEETLRLRAMGGGLQKVAAKPAA